MRTWSMARTVLVTVVVLFAALGGGCSSARTVFDLVVAASPNPVSGIPDGTGRRWNFTITITNPTATPVRIAYYHSGVTGTDTGYVQNLQLVDDSPVIGTRIESGRQASYAANRVSGGRFSSGTERRIFHALGDDGKYYSGEVLIALR